jgi:hypothetical protein
MWTRGNVITFANVITRAGALAGGNRPSPSHRFAAGPALSREGRARGFLGASRVSPGLLRGDGGGWGAAGFELGGDQKA